MIQLPDTLNHVQMSGRFDATPDELKIALTYYALHPDVLADVITLTEADFARLRVALEEWAADNDWFVHHPRGAGKQECAILSRFPFAAKKAWRLSPLTLRSSRSAPLYLVAARIVGGPWFAVWHTPAHNGGLSTSGKAAWPTRVYTSALAGLYVARMKMRGFGLVIGADWNLDLRRALVRARLLKPYPHMELGYQDGQKATEGGRVIDGILTNLTIVIASITLAAKPGFDHRAVLTVIARKRRKRKH